MPKGKCKIESSQYLCKLNNFFKNVVKCVPSDAELITCEKDIFKILGLPYKTQKKEMN